MTRTTDILFIQKKLALGNNDTTEALIVKAQKPNRHTNYHKTIDAVIQMWKFPTFEKILQIGSFQAPRKQKWVEDLRCRKIEKCFCSSNHIS